MGGQAQSVLARLVCRKATEKEKKSAQLRELPGRCGHRPPTNIHETFIHAIVLAGTLEISRRKRAVFTIFVIFVLDIPARCL